MTTRKQTTAMLGKLMEHIDCAMFTTVGANGYLVSRPLSTQAAQFDGSRVWFFVDAQSPKVAEIRRHPKVNLAYASKSENTYISAAGDARLVRDAAKIDALWSDALKAFFPKGKADPNLALIEVTLRTVEYWDGPGTWIGQAISYVVALATGNDDAMGENRLVDVATGRSRRPPGSDRPSGTRRAAKPRAPRKAATKTRARTVRKAATKVAKR
jgi:general stress protein 26